MHHRREGADGLEEAGGGLAEAEEALRLAQGVVSQLEARLTGLLAPSLGQARVRAGDFQRQCDSLRARLHACAGASEEGTDELRKLSRRDLCEIKQFTKNPPDAIRRTLVAAWLLLNGDRFAGSERVSFDEVRDWPKCQRMLAQDGFIEKILRFEVQRLDDLPHVVCHVAERFFGMPFQNHRHRGSRGARAAAPDAAAAQHDSAAWRVAAADPAGSAPVLPLLGRLWRVGAPNGGVGSCDARPELVKRSATTGSLGSPRLPRASSSKEAPAAKALLDEQMVENACKPMASLLRWMLTLIRGHVDRSGLRASLAEAEAGLAEAEALCARLQVDEAATQAELVPARAEATRLSAWVQQLRAGEEAAARALKDMARLEAIAAPAQPALRHKARPRPLLFQDGAGGAGDAAAGGHAAGWSGPAAAHGEQLGGARATGPAVAGGAPSRPGSRPCSRGALAADGPRRGAAADGFVGLLRDGPGPHGLPGLAAPRDAPPWELGGARQVAACLAASVEEDGQPAQQGWAAFPGVPLHRGPFGPAEVCEEEPSGASAARLRRAGSAARARALAAAPAAAAAAGPAAYATTLGAVLQSFQKQQEEGARPDAGPDAGAADPDRLPPTPASVAARRRRRVRDGGLVMTGMLAKTERFDGRADVLSRAPAYA